VRPRTRARVGRAAATPVAGVVAAAVSSLAMGAAAAPIAGRAEPAGGAVVLDAAGCPAAAAAAVRQAVSLELGDLLVTPGATPPPPDADLLTIACDGGGGEASLRASGPARAAPIERRLSLTDFPPDAAPRALALAGIEMLAALSPAVRARIQARQRAEDAPEAPRPPAPAPRTRIALLAIGRSFLSDAGLTGWGGRIDLQRTTGARFDLTGDLELAAASSSNSALGDASAALASVGGFWGVRAGSGRFVGSIAAGARAGLVRLAGSATPGSGATSRTALRPWVGPALSARLSVGGARLALVAMVEAGLAVRGAEGLAGAAAVVAASGGWVAAGIGSSF
jgi:hypothetical protein